MITRNHIKKFVSLLFQDKKFEQMVVDVDIVREEYNKCVIKIYDEVSVGDLYNAATQANMNCYNICMYVNGSGHPIIIIHDYSNDALLD